MAGLRVACVVAVMCMVVALSARAPMGAPSSSISCSTVTNYLSPCYSYLRNGGKPSSSCCDGVKNIYNEDKNTADVRATCNCLKSLASETTVSANYAASLPAECDVKIPYKISNSTDCTKITI
ncbi:non-specific lipid-transfer protein 1 [Cajanus cajan]|uniref:non-specific lipid-transfer protein 1 n=1 Tax=Cajanus cajan TaxID=3821 RepID=UPI00098D8AF0|nr:non-specific lipid-transfer protein 1 [Cajanus cajan]